MATNSCNDFSESPRKLSFFEIGLPYTRTLLPMPEPEDSSYTLSKIKQTLSTSLVSDLKSSLMANQPVDIKVSQESSSQDNKYQEDIWLSDSDQDPHRHDRVLANNQFHQLSTMHNKVNSYALNILIA
jgi:hypothetical protein